MAEGHAPGTVGEVFRVFLRFGATSFGGPIAHLAIFHRELVAGRRWLSEEEYAQVVAYCQFLPGPTSSQVGLLIGWQRAGLRGALAAWLGFTAPASIALAAAALLLGTVDTSGAWLIGMKAAVLAIVAQAVVAMVRSLCPDAQRATIAAGAVILCLVSPAAWTQVTVLILAGLTGALLPAPADVSAGTGGVRTPGAWLSACCLGLLGLLVGGIVAMQWLAPGPFAALVGASAKAGGLVFGGGHVVLPLLRDPLVQGGLLSDSQFLAAYGAAQAVPGPLFAVAAWLGALVLGWGGALSAVIAIFAPGMLLALGCLRFFHLALASTWTRRVMLGLNAGVVGVLGAALWSPIGSEAVHAPIGAPLALIAFIALASWRASPWAVVLGCCLATELAAHLT